MQLVILQAADTRKKVPSSAGMQRSVKTSELIDYRAKHIVPKRTDDIIKVRKGSLIVILWIYWNIPFLIGGTICSTNTSSNQCMKPNYN